MQISARNQLRARIRSITLGDLMAELVLELAGQEIVALITRSSAEHMGLKVGDDVVAIVKSTEVMIGR